MRAAQVIDLQGDLLGWFERPVFRKLFTYTLEPTWGVGNHTVISELPNMTYHHIRDALAFHVTEDMTELVQAAANALHETKDRFTVDLAPAPSGFVRFDRPLVINDVHGQDMLMHALTWGPTKLVLRGDEGEHSGLFFTFWNDVDTEPDSYALELARVHGRAWLQRVSGRWSLIGAETAFDGMRVGSQKIALSPERRARLVAPDGTERPFTNPIRLIVALFLLLDQTIVETRRERPDPHTRRRATRRRLRSTAEVTVVSLRRRAVRRAPDDGDDHRHVDWSCRWPVRGHWRWARVGKGRTGRRRVWIPEVIKGPEDKPLVIRKKVYELRR